MFNLFKKRHKDELIYNYSFRDPMREERQLFNKYFIIASGSEYFLRYDESTNSIFTIRLYTDVHRHGDYPRYNSYIYDINSGTSTRVDVNKVEYYLNLPIVTPLHNELLPESYKFHPVTNTNLVYPHGYFLADVNNKTELVYSKNGKIFDTKQHVEITASFVMNNIIRYIKKDNEREDIISYEILFSDVTKSPYYKLFGQSYICYDKDMLDNVEVVVNSDGNIVTKLIQRDGTRNIPFEVYWWKHN